MLNVSIYLNINHFLASEKKIKCILKQFNKKSNFTKILPKYNKKPFIKLLISYFRLWVSQFLSKYLICKVKYPRFYHRNFLKKFITAQLNIKQINLFYTFYSTGIQIAKIFNDKIMITTLRDIFLQTVIEILQEVFLNLSISIKKLKILCRNIRDIEKNLIKCIQNPILKLKIYYILS